MESCLKYMFDLGAEVDKFALCSESPPCICHADDGERICVRPDEITALCPVRIF
jgi:hypothetical protein